MIFRKRNIKWEFWRERKHIVVIAFGEISNQLISPKLTLPLVEFPCRRSITNIHDWHHVSCRINVADCHRRLTHFPSVGILSCACMTLCRVDSLCQFECACVCVLCVCVCERVLCAMSVRQVGFRMKNFVVRQIFYRFIINLMWPGRIHDSNIGGMEMVRLSAIG